MQRSRLKNIINKSKSISNKQEVGNPFDEFKKSLPIEIDDNYRLEAAWKAYGSPKDYKTALWNGMIQPIDETNVKLPSIGYNEETDEYEYLNKGEDNETVAKDIRVWDNDVIPLVQELKLGGYVRTFNKEKDCWTYTKNSQKREQPIEDKGEQVIDSFQKGGKPKKVKSDQSYYDSETDTIYYSGEKRKDRKEAYKHEYVHSRPNEYSELFDYLKPYYENLNDDKISELGGNLEFVKRFNGDPNHFYNPEELVARMVAASYRTRNVPEYSEEFFEDLRQNENKYGDNMRDLLHMYNNKNLSQMFKYFRKPVSEGFGAGGFYQDPKGEIGDGMSLRPTGEYAPDGQEYYISPSGDRYTLQPQAFKQGGQMSVIPEGALHARKNNMEGAGEDFTAKGIPVVDNEGEQQAEIEKEEIIFSKSVTDKVEDLFKKYESDETSQSEKDEIAIKMGKIITRELMTNTDDRTGLIEDIANDRR